MSKPFIARKYLNDLTVISGARDKTFWDGNSASLLSQPLGPKYMFIGDFMFTSETPGDVNKRLYPIMGKNDALSPLAYGQKGKI